jgi:hypothetical protein
VQHPGEEQRVRTLVASVVAALEGELFRDPSLDYDSLIAGALRGYVLAAARKCDLSEGVARESRLFDESLAASSLVVAPGIELEPEHVAFDVGHLLEALLARAVKEEKGRLRVLPARGRKQTGSFYTSSALSARVVESCLDLRRELPRSVCDPAVGAGAFLLAAAEALVARGARSRREIVAERLYGVDISRIAIAVTEIALWLWVAETGFSPREAGRHLAQSDTLLGDLQGSFPEIERAGGFELLIGNPPWIAYAGRAAQPLDPKRRARLQARFSAFRGYPTLHGLFVERAAELAPRGVIGLLLPSPLADLDGYRPVRRALTRTHAVAEPLLEFGQDAFASVTQPCFALIAAPNESAGHGQDAAFRLVERQRKDGAAAEVKTPRAVERLIARPSLPRELFGEMGFQSRRLVTERLFRRGSAGAGHEYPLLEGKDVAEFRVGEARLFLKPDRELLSRLGVKLRPETEYQRVSFVVRQTAKVTIAALHSGLPFRNTLIAGFQHELLEPELMVGLLNSALYRALHLSRQRDARQATFPQVKVAHLRALPLPPLDAELLGRVASLACRATAEGVSPSLRSELDSAVFDAFGVSTSEREEVLDFIRRRAPELGHGANAGSTSSEGVTLLTAPA